MESELIWLSASELLEGYRAGRFSPVEVTEAVLARIEAKDHLLNSFCLVDAERALEQARGSESRWARGEPAGRLDGVPTLVKDLILTAGWPTLRGSRTVDRAGPWDDDGPSVARLKEHGAVLIGKTTTPEFGWKGVTDSPLTGITRNPWDPSKTPGGSSGGSSAAIAAGMGALAIGTDGGGSIRIPAGFTGIFGHKPHFGRVPAWPMSPFGTVAHVGPMTRTVEDAALMLSVMAEPDPRDWYALAHDPEIGPGAVLEGGMRGLRVAYSADLGYVDVDPEIAGLVDRAVESLASLGAQVEAVDPGFDDPLATFRVLWWCGARKLLGHLPESQLDQLDPGLRAVVEESRQLSLEDYFGAVTAREELGRIMREFLVDYDVLVTPTLPIAAFEAGELAPARDDFGKWTTWTPFSFPFNLTQQPAASVPCGFTAAGLPAGLQIVGRMFDDMTVLRVAHAYQKAHDWNAVRPPL